MSKEFLDSLIPSPYKLTGAIKRKAKAQDWSMVNAPGVADELAGGVPPSFSCIDDNKIEVDYVQVGSSCVPTSSSVVQSINDFKDGERWRMYDAQEMYRALGGTGSQGVPTDGVLARMKQIGLAEVGKPRRAKIAGYAFAPRVAGAWRQTIAAAMIASGPVVIATLLPVKFGWDSSGSLTSGYHQMAATRYEGLGDGDYVVFRNTWGRGGGRDGFYRLPWGMLESQNFQDNHVYGYQVIDLDDLEPEPTPDPPVGVVSFNAKVKVKKQGKKLALALDPAVEEVAKLAGHVVEVSEPNTFKARVVGVASRDFVVLKPIGGNSGIVNGQFQFKLRVIE